MKRKIMLSVLIASFLVISMVSTISAEDITIRWAMHPGVWNDAVIEYFAPQYEELTGIKVEPELLPPDEMRDKMVLEAASGTDYFQMGYNSASWIGYYYEYLADLTPYIEKYDFDLDAYADSIIEEYMQTELRPGDYVSMPFYASTSVFIFRKDWFEHPDEQEAFMEEYGRELRPPETWKEFHETGKFFTREAGETLMGEELEHSIYGTAEAMRYPSGAARSFLALFYSMGFEGFDENMEPDLDHPMLIEGAEFYKEFVQDTMPSQVINWDLWEPIGYFSDGRVAMSLMGAGGWSYVEDEEADSRGNVGYTTIPKWEDNLRDLPIGISYFAGGSLGVFDTEYTEETFKFLQWMLEENSKEWLDRTGALSRKEHFDDPDLAEMPHFDEWSVAFETQLDYAFSRQNVPEYGTVIWSAAGDFWNDVLSGDLTPEEAQQRWIDTMTREFEAAGYYD